MPRTRMHAFLWCGGGRGLRGGRETKREGWNGKYVDGDDISIDIGSVYSADGKTKTGTKQDIRTYYDLEVPLSQMNAAAVGEISGVAGMGYNAIKNFYEVNLKMNNNIKGNIFPNEYKERVFPSKLQEDKHF